MDQHQINQQIKEVVDHQFVLTHRRINELIQKHEALERELIYLKEDLNRLKKRNLEFEEV